MYGLHPPVRFLNSYKVGSAIDYLGRWKMLQYYAKEFFSPVLVSAYENNASLHIFLTSDVLQVIHGFLEIIVHGYNSVGRFAQFQIPVTCPDNDSIEVFSVPDLDEWLQKRGTNRQEAFLILRFKSENRILSENVHYPIKWKNIPFIERPVITLHSEGQEDGELWLETNQPAFFVWLECPLAGRFNWNGGVLLPNERKIIQYHNKNASWSDHVEIWCQNVKIMSLYDCYGQ
jgi:beta-mannosidase